MKKVIKTDKAPKAIGPYSQAILTTYGHFLFISGVLPINPETNEIVEGGIREQTKQVMKNIFSILETQEINFDNIIRCDVFLTDLNNFQAFNEEYSKFFKNNNYPARVTVEVSKLPKNALIEIAVIAGM
jgi:2-iminobutanoate/2-iminopropanoate deaminase